MTTPMTGRLAILVGGGPAPGINSVISAATIKAINEGLEVLGIEDGFKWLIRRDTSHARPLSIAEVSRVHLKGGSILGTARENPTRSNEAMTAVIESLGALGVSYLLTIGGDDTALSSSSVAAASNGRVRTVHVPKTIDNDLPLPGHISTFGFQTARHVGVEIVQSLMEDAKSTRRWYVVVAMGRQAGHLALGIGKAAGATLTLIREEFGDETLKFSDLCSIVEGAIIKRRAGGGYFGVAVLAEGLIDKLDPAELAELEDVERDDHGHIRFAEVDLARKVKVEVQSRLKQRGISVTITNKNIGYELRCADPIPFDAVYCRDLGNGGVRFLLSGVSGAMVTVEDGRMVPMAFADMRDPLTGKTRVRNVDPEGANFRVARTFMIRLDQSDFKDAPWLDKLARSGGMSVGEFRNHFEHLS